MHWESAFHPPFRAFATVVSVSAIVAAAACDYARDATSPRTGLRPAGIAAADRGGQHENDLPDGAVITSALTTTLERFDASGKRMSIERGPDIPLNGSVVNGTAIARITAGLPIGVEAKFPFFETLHGKKHHMHEHTTPFLDRFGNQWMVSSNGQADGGPLASVTYYRGMEVMATTQTTWARVPGGWALGTLTMTIFANGKPSGRVTLSAQPHRVASRGAASRLLVDATRVLLRGGALAADFVMPQVAHAQPPQDPVCLDGAYFSPEAGQCLCTNGVAYDGQTGCIATTTVLGLVGGAIGAVVGAIGAVIGSTVAVAVGAVILAATAIISLADYAGFFDDAWCWEMLQNGLANTQEYFDAGCLGG